MTPICCSIKEAISASGLPRSTLYELMAAGKLDSVKIGKRRLIRVASLEQLLSRVQYMSNIPDGTAPDTPG